MERKNANPKLVPPLQSALCGHSDMHVAEDGASFRDGWLLPPPSVLPPWMVVVRLGGRSEDQGAKQECLNLRMHSLNRIESYFWARELKSKDMTWVSAGPRGHRSAGGVKGM